MISFIEYYKTREGFLGGFELLELLTVYMLLYNKSYLPNFRHEIIENNLLNS